LKAGILASVLALALCSPEKALGQGQRHFREGLEVYQRGDLDAAVRQFTLAIESGDLPHPDLFFAFNNRGNAYAARGDHDRALKDYDDALRFNPKFAAAMRNRGTLHAWKGDYDSAIRDCSDAAQLDPDDPHSLIGRALVYCAKREFANAIRDFDAALRICPACPFAVTGRASASSGKECR
jgi:tetratricopeptide (TPR) repeat protein